MSISQSRGQNFGSGGEKTSDKILYMNSPQVLYCNGVAKISVQGGHFETFETFRKIYKKFAQKFKNFSKMF